MTAALPELLTEAEAAKPYSPETLADRWGCSAEKVRLMYRNGELFAEHRLHGEWFSPHPDILAEIDRLARKEAND